MSRPFQKRPQGNSAAALIQAAYGKFVMTKDQLSESERIAEFARQLGIPPQEAERILAIKVRVPKGRKIQ